MSMKSKEKAPSPEKPKKKNPKWDHLFKKNASMLRLSVDGKRQMIYFRSVVMFQCNCGSREQLEQFQQKQNLEEGPVYQCVLGAFLVVPKFSQSW